MKKKQRKRSTSAKPKKVTLKFFLNEAVLPMIEGRTKRYPLYVMITYNRKNTMMRCHYGKYYKDLHEIDKVHYPGLLSLEEKIIRKTLDYEITQSGEQFDLRGIHRKYDLYSVGIHVLLEEHMKAQLWNALMKLEPFEFAKALNFTDPDVTFDTAYKMSARLYKGFASALAVNFEQEVEMYQLFVKLYRGSFFQYTFPTVIEWLDHSAITNYSEMLTRASMTPSLVHKSIEFVDAVVRSKMKQG